MIDLLPPSLTTTGSVAFKFSKVGQMDVAGLAPEQSDSFVDTAITLGADDVDELEVCACCVRPVCVLCVFRRLWFVTVRTFNRTHATLL
jgi:transcriptional/translational regulatory protein YebC/TACO1